MASGKVGSISLTVIPDLKGLREKLKVAIDRIERSTKIKLQVEFEIDNASMSRVKSSIKSQLRDEKVKVAAAVDKASLAKTRSQIEAAARDAKTHIKVEVDRNGVQRARLALVRAMEGIKVKPHVDYKPLEKEIRGRTFVKYIGAVWQPGSLDQLKGTFYSKFPALRPWIWPEVDFAYIKTAAKNTLTAFRNSWNSLSGRTFRVGMYATWHDKQGMIRKLTQSLGHIRAYLVAEFDRTEFGKATLALLRTARRDFRKLTFPVRAVWDQVSRVKLFSGVKLMASLLGKVATIPFIAVWDARPVAAVRGAVAAVARTLWKYGKIPFKAVWDSRAMSAVRSKVSEATKNLVKGIPIRAKMTLQWAASAIRFLNRLGVTRLVKYKIQLLTNEALKRARQLGTLIKASLALGVVGGAFMSVVQSGLNGINSIVVAAKRIAPAMGAAVGIMASFAAGAGVAVVALKKASDELKALEAPLKAVQKGIEDAFWKSAKPVVLENAQKLIAGLNKDVYALSAGMGSVFANIAKGAGASMAQFQTVIQNAKRGFDNMGPGLNALTQALANFIAAASSFFPRFGQWITDISNKFLAWTQQMGQSGLEDWMNRGWAATKTLADILGNTVGIFWQIVKAASGGAAGMEEFNRKLESMKQKLATPEMQTGLRDMFNGAKQGLDFIQQALGNFVNQLPQMGEAIGRVFSAAGQLIGTFADTLGKIFSNPAVLEGIQQIVLGFDALFRAVQPVVQMLAEKLGGILADIGRVMQQMAPDVQKLAGYFGEFAGISFDAIGQLVQIILPPLVEIMNELMPAINEITKAILPPMLEIIKQLMPFIKWVVDIIVQELVPILAELIPRIGAVVESLLPPLLEVLKKIIPPVIEMVKDLMPAAVSIFEALQPVLKVVIDILGAILPPIIKAFAGTVKFLIGVIQTCIDIFKWLWEVAKEVWNAISRFVGSAVDAVGRAISNGMHWISGVWSNAWNGIKSFVKGLWDGIVGFFREGVRIIGNIFKSIGKAIMAPFKAAFNAIARFWNNTVGRLSFTIPDWVPGIGGAGFSMPKIPTFARGGIVDKATLAVIGEGGENEAVIPLSKLQPMIDKGVNAALAETGGGSTVYNVNMTLDARQLKNLDSLDRFIRLLQVKAHMYGGDI